MFILSSAHPPNVRPFFPEEAVTNEAKKAKDLEVAAVKAAESGNLDEAIRLFTEAISVCPDRPSCYNNRAQALRLRHDVPGKYPKCFIA